MAVVTLTAAQLATELGAENAQITKVTRLLKLAKARVERYAPAAPTCTKTEAVILLAAYHWQASAQAREILPADGEGRPVNVSNAFRNSGAQGLLSPWRVLRAGRTKPQ